MSIVVVWRHESRQMDVVLIGIWIQRWLLRNNDDDVETKALKTVLRDAGGRIDLMDPTLQAIRERFESASQELLSALSLQAIASSISSPCASIGSPIAGGTG